MTKFAPSLALLLAGCWQVAVVGDPSTTGGNSSTGGRSTSGGTGTGRSTGGSTGGRSSSGTSTGGIGQCGRCAPGATCDAGLCVCPGDDGGDTCDYNKTLELFCAEGACVSCNAHNGTLTLAGAGDQCLIPLAFAEFNPDCIAVDGTSVYWTDAYGIQKVSIVDLRMPLDGGIVPQTLYAIKDPVCLAIDAYNVYFTVSDDTVREVPIGGGASTIIAYAQKGPQGIVVDRDNIYWTNSAGNQVMRLEKTAAPVLPDMIAELDDGGAPFGIAIDSTNVYWTDRFGATVLMTPLDGGAPVTIASNQGEPFDIAVDATNVYWTDRSGGEVFKQPLAGPFNGGTRLASNQGEPTGIALDSSYVYWTDFSGNSVNYVPIDGGTVRSIPVAATEAYRIAVDKTNLYWTSYDQGLGFVYELTPK